MMMSMMSTAAPGAVRLGQSVRLAHATPAQQAQPRYLEVRQIALATADALRRYAPRSPEATAAVRAFQPAAAVEPVNGLYGPATMTALGFFLPDDVAVPPLWPNVGPGSWSPPSWTEVHETVVDRPRWFARWVLPFAGSIVLSGILVVAEGIRESRRARKGGT